MCSLIREHIAYLDSFYCKTNKQKKNPTSYGYHVVWEDETDVWVMHFGEHAQVANVFEE